VTPPKRLVVVGASAGGIEALRTLLGGLPSTFPAAICIVLHTSPDSPGILGEILGRSTALPVEQARDRQRLQSGHVYIAPAGFHLLVEPGLLRVTKGPREHGFRPAIDPLFRSAAQVYGPAAIGVVLTGNLDDGAAGLWVINRLGGTTVVQDPEDAMFPSMPTHAQQHVQVDYSVPLVRIPSLLTDLTSGAAHEVTVAAVPEHIDVEVRIAKEHNPREAGLERLGLPSPYACPDCHGVLLALSQEGRVRFRCHIGHGYSINSLLAAIAARIDDELASAVRSLEEGGLLIERVATQLKEQQDHEGSTRMAAAAQRVRLQAAAIRELSRERPAASTLLQMDSNSTARDGHTVAASDRGGEEGS
jgi:two-component system chemotaxis response regulator CheB